MDLKLNFMGIVVADWHSAYAYYKNIMGFHTHLDPQYDECWAILGSNQDAEHAATKSAVVELFDRGRRPSPERAWGKGQGIRPSIQVNDLSAAVETLRGRGVTFTTDMMATAWGQRIEFAAAEGFRWSLSQVAGKPSGADFSRPVIGHFEIKAHHFDEQKQFYGDLLGMRLEQAAEEYAILGQGQDELWIVIEAGGEAQATDPAANDPARSQSMFMSFMTSNVAASAQYLRDAGVPILEAVKHHADWGGTDLITADADGNILQIVEYTDL